MSWKHTTVNAKVSFTLGYDAPGYRVRKGDIEHMLYDCLASLIEEGAFKELERDVYLTFQVPTTVTLELE